ncbi:hypothetical protein BDV59DRAFT_207614 [Aspergillus ambiguus]|uniref:putative pentafunctional AROM polypeptide n=1 Tax=Aspergillus ambiguus TaxID=176160 RepID=UPI003CCD87BC
MASVALRRRFIDFPTYFQDNLHISRYLEAERELSHGLLVKYPRGCTLFQEFGKQNPIIYILRDKEVLQQSMAINKDAFDRIITSGDRLFRSCSNFDYYNLTESADSETDDTRPIYLKLKETESTFVRFLNRISGVSDRSRYSVDPFFASPTYSLQVPVNWLNEPCQNYDELENGTDAISLVIDTVHFREHDLTETIARCVALLKRYSRAPIILDLRSSRNSDITDYLNILNLVTRLVPDAFTCSLSCPDEHFEKLVGNSGHAKVIATYHQKSPLKWSSDYRDFASIYNRAYKLGCTAVRITGESSLPQDNLGCVGFQERIVSESPIPIIAYHVGRPGRPSACLNPVLSPVVLESMRSEGVTLQEAQLALSGCFLVEQRRFTIIGKDLSSSLSPEMHNAAYAACGLPHTYNLTESLNLSDINEILDNPQYGGVAVSLPYKTEVLKYLDEISEDAQDINAVNTVVIEIETRPQPGSLPLSRRIRKGFNTDYLGIRHCIYKHLSPANGVRDSTAALIIGAGGMAHAAVYACHQLGVRNICIFNRTTYNAQKLIDYFTPWAASKIGPPLNFTLLQSTSDKWPAQLRPPTIIVSCIPNPQNQPESFTFQLPDQWLQSKTGGVYVEVAYGPTRTGVLKKLESFTSQGWIIADGFDVLLEQGIAQYELFTKRPAPVHVMKHAIHHFAMQRFNRHLS